MFSYQDFGEPVVIQDFGEPVVIQYILRTRNGKTVLWNVK